MTPSDIKYGEPGLHRIFLGAAISLAIIAVSLPFVIWSPGERVSASGSRSPFAQLDVRTYASVEELGEALFFDGRLSGDTTVSCATCHQPGKAYADGLALSNGFTSTKYFRNTPTLLNAGAQPVSYWDGRIDGDDLATVVRDHLVEAHFMASDGRIIQERMRQIPEYEQSFIDLMGGEASFGKVQSALVAYLRTLKSENNRYIEFVGGDAAALSEAEQRGLELFSGAAGCSSCHSGELLSDGQLHVTGVHENPDVFTDPERHITFRRFFRQFGIGDFVTLREDIGAAALTHEAPDRGAFRTPSLLEAGQTAPYMHNGVFATLDEVVRFYNGGGGSDELTPLGLAESEIADLVAFLESLKSDLAPAAPPELPDYELRTPGVN